MLRVGSALPGTVFLHTCRLLPGEDLGGGLERSTTEGQAQRGEEIARGHAVSKCQESPPSAWLQSPLQGTLRGVRRSPGLFLVHGANDGELKGVSGEKRESGFGTGFV